MTKRLGPSNGHRHCRSCRDGSLKRSRSRCLHSQRRDRLRSSRQTGGGIFFLSVQVSFWFRVSGSGSVVYGTPAYALPSCDPCVARLAGAWHDGSCFSAQASCLAGGCVYVSCRLVQVKSTRSNDVSIPLTQVDIPSLGERTRL